MRSNRCIYFISLVDSDLGIILSPWLFLFQVTWPMNILIPPDQLTKYERIFSFMVSLKHISYLLADSWHSLKLSTQTHQIESSQSHQFRQLHLIRYIIPKTNYIRTDCLPLIYSDHLDILILLTMDWSYVDYACVALPL